MNGKSNGKKKKKKKGAAKSGGGLFSRLLKNTGKEDKAGNGGKAKAKAKPLTPLERSIQEIKHMAKVGESDPERLAGLLSQLLGGEQEKRRQAQEDFDKMVWDIVNKDDEKNNEES
ncbi:MAG TPA: hypothetical protein QGF95_18550 [Candidatus Latescibacteria bacterium]|nr:hypothetical protein [Gemmatimonadaceae bacterium]MDP6017634.1 hypothetical protein [Candidatus Latescibacterota bacterium]HJP32549.1 hypothetical protein [Candidatus Latescibacterota bacterium]